MFLSIEVNNCNAFKIVINAKMRTKLNISVKVIKGITVIC